MVNFVGFQSSFGEEKKGFLIWFLLEFWLEFFVVLGVVFRLVFTGDS